MRLPEIYAKNTKKLCGRVLNHDDDILIFLLSLSFFITFSSSPPSSFLFL